MPRKGASAPNLAVGALACEKINENNFEKTDFAAWHLPYLMLKAAHWPQRSCPPWGWLGKSMQRIEERAALCVVSSLQVWVW
jgi:hypothetical protein